MNLDFSDWLTWFSIGIGIAVTVAVVWVSSLISFRKRSARLSEDELPWEQMLELLKSKKQGDKLPENWESLSSEEQLDRLLRQLQETPAAPNNSTSKMPAPDDDIEFLKAGQQRRASTRRWLNPTELRLSTGVGKASLKGVVVNRSTGGVAILTDQEFAVGAVLFVMPIEAPKGLPEIAVTVRHTRRAGELWIIGCQFLKELPWNVKVWFG